MTEIAVLRPWSFVFIIPLLLFCFFRLKAVQAWLGVVDAHLIDSLAVKTSVSLKRRFLSFFFIVCALSLLAALAGVSLKSGRAELYHPKSPAVIMLDMSLSMKVNDVQPNRFSRAIFKIYDILDELKGVPVAFIVFTDEPYLLVPATTDKKVIEAILPLLNFSLMPSQGTRTDRAIKEALNAIRETGAAFGDIFLITDGGEDVLEVQEKTENEIKRAALNKNRLFILGVGTPEGGLLFEKEDKPVSDALGNPVRHGLKEGLLKRWATAGAGKYVRSQSDGSDVVALIKGKSGVLTGEKSSLRDTFLSDTGYWFLILPLIGFPFLFKNGRLLAFLFAVSTALPARADMIDLFLSPSAAAMRKLNGNEPEAGAAIAKSSRDFIALYNVGTRLILLEKYPQAVDLLTEAVQIRPEDENARINLEIAGRLSKKPSEDNSPNGGENDRSSNPDQAGDKQGQNGQDGENNLNQNNKNEKQDAENNEKSSNEQDDKDGRNDEHKENGGDGSNGNGEAGNPPSADGGGSSGDDAKDQGGSGNENGMIPVHEDPLTLLRYKILFLHRENRYNQEKRIGAQW